VLFLLAEIATLGTTFVEGSARHASNYVRTKKA
jgi:hypothetical protein